MSRIIDAILWAASWALALAVVSFLWLYTHPLRKAW
jgi:hypothetical protein